MESDELTSLTSLKKLTTWTTPNLGEGLNNERSGISQRFRFKVCDTIRMGKIVLQARETSYRIQKQGPRMPHGHLSQEQTSTYITSPPEIRSINPRANRRRHYRYEKDIRGPESSHKKRTTDITVNC